MGSKIYFACPTDEDVILFEEDMQMMRLMTAERPETCRKCGKSYYKWECSAKPEDETSGPGHNRRNP